MSTRIRSSRKSALSLGVGLSLSAALCLLGPSRAHATIYFSAPGQANLNYQVAPTRLVAVDETSGDVTDLGTVTLDGEEIAVAALAMSPGGQLIGFISLDPANDPTASVAVSIDPETMTATLASAEFSAQLNGAAFDRYGGLWVTDRQAKTMLAFDLEAAEPLDLESAFDLPLPPVPFDDINGHDIAFDLDNNCYFIATTANSSSPLYSCDVEAGSFTELGPLLGVGFGNTPPSDFNSSCLAFSLSSDDCSQVMTACDGWAEDEVGIIDVDTLTFTQTASLEVNVSWYNWTDMAGFPSVVNTPECNLCGDGNLDPGEECDDGNAVDDDGCSNACLWNDSDGDGVHDGDDMCPGFDDALDQDQDGVADGCDNCPETANPDQGDSDDDGIGDACDQGGSDSTDSGTETSSDSGTETSSDSGETTTAGDTDTETSSDSGTESDGGSGSEDDVAGDGDSGETGDDHECQLDDGCGGCSSDPDKSAPYSLMAFLGLMLLRRRRRSN